MTSSFSIRRASVENVEALIDMRLLEELDCGTFGRVYRAKHAYLPNRPFYATLFIVTSSLKIFCSTQKARHCWPILALLPF